MTSPISCNLNAVKHCSQSKEICKSREAFIGESDRSAMTADTRTLTGFDMYMHAPLFEHNLALCMLTNRNDISPGCLPDLLSLIFYFGLMASPLRLQRYNSLLIDRRGLDFSTFYLPGFEVCPENRYPGAGKRICSQRGGVKVTLCEILKQGFW
jgi:hypothetical protein